MARRRRAVDRVQRLQVVAHRKLLLHMDELAVRLIPGHAAVGGYGQRELHIHRIRAVLRVQ